MFIKSKYCPGFINSTILYNVFTVTKFILHHVEQVLEERALYRFKLCCYSTFTYDIMVKI